MKDSHRVRNAPSLLLALAGFVASGSPVLAAYMVQYFGPGLSLVNNPLDAEPSVVTKVLTSYVARDGFSIYAIERTGFVANNYLGGWSDPGMRLPIGSAWFLRNPFGAFTNVFVGTAYAGTNRLAAGWNACGPIQALAGRIQTDLLCPVAANDVVYVFNKTNQAYESCRFTTQWQPFEPSIGFCEGFWVQKSAAADWIDLRELSARWLNTHSAITSTVGQVNFFTFNPYNPGAGRVSDTNGVPLGANYVGQLYAGRVNEEAALSPIGTPVRFGCGPAAGYIRGGAVPVPDTLGGQTVYLQLRVWDDALAASFEAATSIDASRGKSLIFAAQTGATIVDGHPGLPPERADGFPSFTVPGTAAQRTLAATSVRLSNNIPIVTYLGTPGRTYVIEAATSLDQPVWSPISTNVAPACPLFEVTTPPISSGPQRFYRGRLAD